MATYLRTSGLFEIKVADNGIRVMVTSFANEGPETIHLTIRRSTAVPFPGVTGTGGKEIVAEQTLTIPACGTGYFTISDVAPGFYEIDAKYFDNELKVTADIRDGVADDPLSNRWFIGPEGFVRQIEPGT